MSEAAEHLQEAIDVGCTRDDHDHIADHRAEVLNEAGTERYRIAWRMARTRARSAGGAADRYAARARDLQTALQETVFAVIGMQMERDGARVKTLTEISGRLASRATLYGDSTTVNRIIKDLLNLADEQPGKASPAGPTATRERVITHTWPGETPNLTVRLTFGAEWTDDGAKEATSRVKRAAQVGFNVADYTPMEPSPARLAWYTDALRTVDTFARLDEDDRNQIAAAAIACADKNDLDAVYKAAYDLGRSHAESSLNLDQLAALQEIAGFCACAAGTCPSTVARRVLVGEPTTGCTCARSWGLHSRDCRLYVPSHELATNCPHPATQVDDEWVSCSSPHCPNSERYGKAAERGWVNGHMDTWLCPEHPQAGGAR